jgi:sRNA-binding regulator protein Hfq
LWSKRNFFTAFKKISIFEKNGQKLAPSPESFENFTTKLKR